MAVQAQCSACGSQDWMEVGCGGFNHLYPNVQRKQQQQQQHQHQQLQQWSMQQSENLQHQQKIQNLCSDNSLVCSASLGNNYYTPSMSLSQIMVSLHNKQMQEVDHFIRSQNEQVNFLLQEQRRQQLALIQKGVETKLLPILRQKDDEIALATRKCMELEDSLKKLEAESQAWQALARQNEAMVVSLGNAIEQLKDDVPGDAESCVEENRETEVEEVRNRGFAYNGNAEKVRKSMTVCRCCNSVNACIIFLPCRHLSSCRACEASLDSCPLCGMEKMTIIEALIV